jgi:hypothetical protein
MSRDTYVVHNAYFDSGGPWGMFGATMAAYAEAITQRPFAQFFNVLSGSSIGAVTAAALAIHSPAKLFLFSTYACSRVLFPGRMDNMFKKQLANRSLRLFDDHLDHMTLYHTLSPHFGGKVMNDVPGSLLIAAHNLDKKRDEFLGKLDKTLFDERAMKMTFINGSTPLIDGPMASSSIHGVFHPYVVHGQSYGDNGTVITAGHVNREIDRCLKARQKGLHAARPRRSRFDLSAIFGAKAARPPKTLANTDNAVVLTLFLGTGDLSALPYDRQTQIRAGLLGIFDDKQYGLLHAYKRSTQQHDKATMEDHYDPHTSAATGLPAITSVNRSLIPEDGNLQQAACFPSTEQLDCSPKNLHKMSAFATDYYVPENRGTVARFLDVVARNQFAQGAIGEEEHTHLRKACEVLAGPLQNDVLDDLRITDQTGEAVFQKYRPPVPAPAARGWPLRRAVPA